MSRSNGSIDARRFYTVWKFSGVTLPQEPAIVVRTAEPNDLLTQHSYQLVLGQAMAATPAEALRIVSESRAQVAS